MRNYLLPYLHFYPLMLVTHAMQLATLIQCSERNVVKYYNCVGTQCIKKQQKYSALTVELFIVTWDLNWTLSL